MGSKVAIPSVSFVLMLSSVPLISIGATSGPAGAWVAGLVTLLLGAGVIPLQRLLHPPDWEEASENRRQRKRED